MTAKDFRYLYRTLRQYERKRAWLIVLIVGVAVGCAACAVFTGYAFYHLIDDTAISLCLTVLFSVTLIIADLGATAEIVDNINYCTEKITDILEDYNVA